MKMNKDIEMIVIATVSYDHQIDRRIKVPPASMAAPLPYCSFWVLGTPYAMLSIEWTSSVGRLARRIGVNAVRVGSAAVSAAVPP